MQELGLVTATKAQVKTENIKVYFYVEFIEQIKISTFGYILKTSVYATEPIS